METQIIKYEYNGQEVEFDFLKENVMVNATEMAKCYDKETRVFMKSEHAKIYIDSIIQAPFGARIGINSMEELIQNRGRNGIWMHRYLAIYFAMWLDPKFSIWVTVTIEELINGMGNERKALLADKVRLRKEMEEFAQKLEENEDYQKLMDVKAAIMRIGKDLKKNDDLLAEKQLRLL